MQYYFLDEVTWDRSQSLYHAAAHLGHEALFILRPAIPYVCIGYHQDVDQTIDMEFASQQGIPVFRREVGGGAVYLDGDQLFYQLVLRKDHPEAPGNKGEFYEKFLDPVVKTYREFGIPVDYKPVNDIIVNGRKISGNGAAEINDMLVLVGNFILDFDYEMMAKVLRVPDEKFRDKVYKTMQENLTTMGRELGTLPNCTDLADAVSRRYAAVLGEFIMSELPEELVSEADRRFQEMHTGDWLRMNDQRRPDLTSVRIREGVSVIQRHLKTPGGLITVTALEQNGMLTDVHISGDFFFYPSGKLWSLERSLVGCSNEQEEIESHISAFYDRNGIESPGVSPPDIAELFSEP